MKQIVMAFALSLTVATPLAAQTAPIDIDRAARAIAVEDQIVVFGTDRVTPAETVITRFNADADSQDGRSTRPGTPIAGTPPHGARIFDLLRAEGRGQ